jgi:xylulose-5-phosphate/fructose-6-phosphate phosphoketolase
MKLQPSSEHPHGLTDADFDSLFTRSKPVIFAFHGYPWLIHHLVQDAIDRLPQLADRGSYLKQEAKAKLLEHRAYICKHGKDMLEVADWKWPGSLAHSVP